MRLGNKNFEPNKMHLVPSLHDLPFRRYVWASKRQISAQLAPNFHCNFFDSKANLKV